MSLKSKIEAVIYASEEPVTLAQLIVLLSVEAQAELDALAARQSELFLDGLNDRSVPIAASSNEHEGSAVAGVSGPGDYSPPQAGSAGDAESAGPTNTATTTPESPNVAQNVSTVEDPGQSAASSSDGEKRQAREQERAIREYLRGIVNDLIREYADLDRGLEIREVAGGFRFGTKPEYHDAVRGFVKSLKPALKLSLQALETLAVVAYKQPVTAAEISEIRGVDSAGVLGGLLTRKLIQAAGRKQVIGRPMLYKTTREFLVRFGLRDVQELPSMEEFERMAGELAEQEDLPMEATDNLIEHTNARGDAEHTREAHRTASADDETASPAEEAGRQPASVTDATGSEDDGRGGAPEPDVKPGNSNVSANGASSPRSEAAPEPSQSSTGTDASGQERA